MPKQFRAAVPLHAPDRLPAYALAGCIAVETSRRDIDDRWLLRLAEAEPFLAGVVLNLRPDEAGFIERMNKACESGPFLGIRLRPIVSYDLQSERLLRNLRVLGEAGKTVEFGAPTAAGKSAFARCAARAPGTTFLLDHAGHPALQSHADEQWLASMRDIAALPNVAVKVTGVCTDFVLWRPLLEALLELFGARRLIYGSNWPVDDLGSIAATAAFLAGDAPAFFCENARAVYRTGEIRQAN
jgi:L-fuconolactonase